MSETIIDTVVSQLQALKGQWPRVAEESGVPLRTLQKIATGETQDPGIRHVQRLLDYFRSNTAH